MHSPQKIAVKLMILGTDQGYSNIQTGSRIKSTANATVKTMDQMWDKECWIRHCILIL